MDTIWKFPGCEDAMRVAEYDLSKLGIKYLNVMYQKWQDQFPADVAIVWPGWEIKLPFPPANISYGLYWIDEDNWDEIIMTQRDPNLKSRIKEKSSLLWAVIHRGYSVTLQQTTTHYVSVEDMGRIVREISLMKSM
jgi:hypothetical protein